MALPAECFVREAHNERIGIRVRGAPSKCVGNLELPSRSMPIWPARNTSPPAGAETA